MRHPLVLWSLLLIAAAASWWLSGRHAAQAPAGAGQAQGPRAVDYYLRRLSATRMGPDGRPDRTLETPELKHFPDDDTTELAQPLLTVHQGDDPPWRIRAEHGWISADASLILLGGAVHINREAGPHNRPLQLDTRDLRVQPGQDYAETDEKVRVRSRRDRIEATGMQAWLRAPARIKLLADVKGYYAPP